MSRGLRNLSECFLPDKSGARKRSREIDAMLKRDRQVATLIVLFGSERGGKTTFLKQMRIVNGDEFNHEELLEFREAIYDNIIRGNEEGVVYLRHSNQVQSRRGRNVEATLTPCGVAEIQEV